jgi:hypothetical protein
MTQKPQSRAVPEILIFCVSTDRLIPTLKHQNGVIWMIEDEIAFLRGLSKPYRKLDYGELSEIVNASYAKTNDIRETMKETGVSFNFPM